MDGGRLENHVVSNSNKFKAIWNGRLVSMRIEYIEQRGCAVRSPMEESIEKEWGTEGDESLCNALP